MPSLITSFGIIRISGDSITQSGHRLQVATDATLMVRDSGAWPSRLEWTNSSGGLQSQINSTGAAVELYADHMGQIISGNVTLTGQTLYNLITNASGLYVPTGSILTYTSGIVTGSDSVYINHLNYTFASAPKVVLELELTAQNYSYFHSISGRSSTGFYLLFSDVIAETGIYANIIAKT